MESELKVITERKDAIENHEKIYAKYYSKARKQREKVKVHSDEYRYQKLILNKKETVETLLLQRFFYGRGEYQVHTSTS